MAGVFAKETGYGFAFAATKDPAASLNAATAPLDSSLEPNGGDKGDDRPKRPSHDVLHVCRHHPPLYPGPRERPGRVRTLPSAET